MALSLDTARDAAIAILAREKRLADYEPQDRPAIRRALDRRGDLIIHARQREQRGGASRAIHVRIGRP